MVSLREKARQVSLTLVSNEKTEVRSCSGSQLICSGFAQDHATSRWTKEDSHHGFLSENFTLLTADDAASILLLILETTCQVTTYQLCHLPLPPSMAVTGRIAMGSHLTPPLLGNKTVIEIAKQ